MLVLSVIRSSVLGLQKYSVVIQIAFRCFAGHGLKMRLTTSEMSEMQSIQNLIRKYNDSADKAVWMSSAAQVVHRTENILVACCGLHMPMA